MPPEHDKECDCGMRVSHHVNVSTLCRRLRESQQRESSLIVEVNDQARLLGMSAERECDLRGKLERLERELQEAREQHRLSSVCRELESKLAAERALADRLAGVLELYYADDTIAHRAGIANALAAWKEARDTPEVTNKQKKPK